MGRSVVLLIGGADGLEDTAQDLAAFVDEGVITVAAKANAVVIDGGTDAGVMALAGQAHRALGEPNPLIGIAPLARVAAPGVEGATGSTPLEPSHTYVVLTPGEAWGDELSWLIGTAKVIAAGGPVVAVLIDGGAIAAREAEAARAEGWPLIVLAGSGRSADALAAASADDGHLVVARMSAGPSALAAIVGSALKAADD